MSLLSTVRNLLTNAVESLLEDKYSKIFMSGLCLVTHYFSNDEKKYGLLVAMKWILGLQLTSHLPLARIFTKCKIPVPFLASCGANLLLKIMIFRKCSMIHINTDSFILKSTWSVIYYNYVVSMFSNFCWLFLLSSAQYLNSLYGFVGGRYDFALAQLQKGIQSLDVLNNHIKDGKINKLNIKYDKYTLCAMPKYEISEEQLETVAPLVCNAVGNMCNVYDVHCCAVCLDNFCEKELHRKLPCNHAFHAHCVDNWLLYKSLSCPLCRKDIVNTQEVNLST